MKLVGVTGGIGAGKSTVCDIFKVLGIPIYNADLEAKKLMTSNQTLREKIIAVFGEESYIGDNVNRDHLAKAVFNSSDQVTKLNLLVHPAVKIDFEKWVRQQQSKYIIKEAALLIETESYKDLDALVSVYASEKTRVTRVMSRDKFRSEEEIIEIIGKQVSDESRNALSGYIIDNNGTDLLIPQVLKLHHSFNS